MSQNFNDHSFNTKLFEEKLTQEFSGDEEILCKMIGIYQNKSSQYLSSLEESIKEKEAKSIVHSSHLFKGAIGNFTVDLPFQILRRIEYMAKNDQLDGMDELLASLKPQLVILNTALSELKTKLSEH